MNRGVISGFITTSFLALLAVGMSSGGSYAQMSGGERIYFEKGGCNQCHGTQGNGVGDDAREHGANLRETALDKETMTMIISCGVPNTNMPYFDKFSYTDDRCYGMDNAAIGKAKPQPPIADFLAKRDVAAVVDYIFDTFVGKGEADPNAKPAAPAAPPSAH